MNTPIKMVPLPVQQWQSSALALVPDPNAAAASALAAIKMSQGGSGIIKPNELEKATYGQTTAGQTSGLTYYDLEPGAKHFYPVLTPLRNIIPRVSGKGGIQANWKAITAINTTGMRPNVSDGHRGGLISVRTMDYNAAYKGIGLESSATFEAQYAAQGFDDVRSLAAMQGMEATMIGEEGIILGGNTSLALGITPTPTVAGSTTGGVLAAQTWSVICVAMCLEAILYGSVPNGIQQQITRTNTDSTTDSFGGGAAGKSAASTVATTGATGSVTASVAPVSGAFGYAWYWGAAGSETLGAITGLNSVIITAPAAGTQTAASLTTSDFSTNSLSFDGLLTIALRANSGATVVTQPTGTAGVGTPLTADGTGGIVEIDQVLKSMWDNLRLTPDTIWLNSQEALNLSKKLLAGSANSAYRVNVTVDPSRMVSGGIMVREYLNRFSMGGGTTIEFKIHPNLPAGTLLMTTSRLPYPLANVQNVMQIRTRQDYYQIEWPLRSRQYEYGVYADEVLQHYFPPALAVITNIGNG